MPKQKTHRGAKKRFKITANKKILYNKSNKSHILTKKSAKRKRRLGKQGLLEGADKRRMKRLLPNDF